MNLRQPSTAAEQAECEAAYESGRMFAVARWEKPGCKYIGYADRRPPEEGGTGCAFVIALEPGSAFFDVAPPYQRAEIVGKGELPRYQIVDENGSAVGPGA